MQDPTASFQAAKPHYPELEQLKCPRCESTNTKFCYYNNYNLSQPRHFCKNCRRYWTKGGALRNIPVGGGTRKNAAKKRPKPDPNPTRKPNDNPPPPPPPAAARSYQEAVSGDDPGRMCGLGVDPDHKMLDIGGSFSSLLAHNGEFGNGFHPAGSGIKVSGLLDGFGSDQSVSAFPGRSSGLQTQNDHNSGGDTSCWSGNSNGWPDLAIYTPSSNFQ